MARDCAAIAPPQAVELDGNGAWSRPVTCTDWLENDLAPPNSSPRTHWPGIHSGCPRLATPVSDPSVAEGPVEVEGADAGVAVEGVELEAAGEAVAELGLVGVLATEADRR